jgi:hypothetical protein
VLAGILIGASFGGFLGSGYMITSAVLVIILWGTFAGLMINAVRLAVSVANETGDLTQALTWANRLFLTVMILAPVTGLGLAFLSFVGCGPLWLPSIYHWGAMIGTILGFLAFFLLPWFVRECVDSSDYPTCHHWAWVVFTPLGVAIVWGLAWLIPYLMLKGDITLSDYAAKNHIYQLPFPGGDSSWVIQGNNSGFNHNNSTFGQKFAWDFRRECGTPVLAARKGTMKTLPDDTHDGIGGTNNQITVDHGDGTVAFYLHIQKGSVTARLRTIGAVVNQGDQIAEVGCVGNSLTGHIHFMVRPGQTATTTVGVSFTDVSDDNGIPRTFGSYTSGNRKVP